MLRLKCLGVQFTHQGWVYQLCDDFNNKRTLTEAQLRFVLETQQAVCDTYIVVNGKLRCKNVKSPARCDNSALSSLLEYKLYVTRNKLMGIDVEGCFKVIGDDVCLVRCPVTNGVFTIPSFVTKLEVYRNCSIFADCVDLKLRNESKITDMSYLFYNAVSLRSLDLSEFDTSRVTNMSHMFYKCASLQNLNLSNFNTSHVTNMCDMFRQCESLRSLDLSSFNTSQVTNMAHMFDFCGVKNLDLSNFDTQRVTDMHNMFSTCGTAMLDLRSFDTSMVTDMSQMFSCSRSLIKLDLSSFDTRQVRSMSLMFAYSSSLRGLDISNFTISKGTTVNKMFCECKIGDFILPDACRTQKALGRRVLQKH